MYSCPTHGFHQTKQGIRFTISEAARREVLDRLLRLNHERYKEEVAAGLHDKGTKKKKASTKPKKGSKKLRQPDAASAKSEDTLGDGKLFDHERQSNLFRTSLSSQRAAQAIIEFRLSFGDR